MFCVLLLTFNVQLLLLFVPEFQSHLSFPLTTTSFRLRNCHSLVWNINCHPHLHNYSVAYLVGVELPPLYSQCSVAYWLEHSSTKLYYDHNLQLGIITNTPKTDPISYQGVRWVILRNYRSDSSCIPIDGMALDIPVSTELTHHPLTDMIVSLLMTLIEVITWMFKLQTYNMSLRSRLPDTAYHICPHYAYVKLHCQIWETSTSTHDCHKSSFLNSNPNS